MAGGGVGKEKEKKKAGWGGLNKRQAEVRGDFLA